MKLKSSFRLFQSFSTLLVQFQKLYLNFGPVMVYFWLSSCPVLVNLLSMSAPVSFHFWFSYCSVFVQFQPIFRKILRGSKTVHSVLIAGVDSGLIRLSVLLSVLRSDKYTQAQQEPSEGKGGLLKFYGCCVIGFEAACLFFRSLCRLTMRTGDRTSDVRSL